MSRAAANKFYIKKMLEHEYFSYLRIQFGVDLIKYLMEYINRWLHYTARICRLMEVQTEHRTRLFNMNNAL